MNKDPINARKGKANPVITIDGDSLHDSYSAKCLVAKKKLAVIKGYAEEFKQIIDYSALFKNKR